MSISTGKVLFISNLPFAETGNNGKTFLSLFRDFQNEEVAQLYFNNVQTNQNVFSNYYRITDIDIIKYILSFRCRKIKGYVEKKQSSNIIISENIFSKKTFWKIKIRNFIFSKIKITELNSFREWIDKFKPTSIFFIGTNYIFSYKILKILSNRYNIPYYIYFTDDYFLYNKGTGFLERMQHAMFIQQTKDIVSNAKEIFVIGEKMKQSYEYYFKQKCTVLINAVEKTNVPDSKVKFHDTIIFRYFGALHSNRSSSLRHIGECLLLMKDKYKLNCILEIYSLTVPDKKTKSDLTLETIRICTPVTGQEFRHKMSTSDFLVHSESFDNKDVMVTMLSVSTKIPEYLVSNRCILAIGPPELASISVLKENNLGIVITEKENLSLHADRIYRVINDINLYNKYCKDSEAFYDKEFNATVMKKYLKNKLLNY